MAESEEVLDLRRRARRRLIGATALVLFLVVVPPWLMDLEPRPVSSNLVVDIPGKDAPKIDPRAIPVPPLKVEPEPSKPGAGEVPAKPSAAATDPKPKPAPAAPAEAAKSPEPSPKPAATDATKAAKPAEVSVPKPAPAPAKPGGDGERAAAILKNEVFFFQLGAFNNRDNAKAVQQKAVQVGVKASTETAEAKGVEQTRVVAGPFGTREAAEKARTRLKEAGIEPGPVRSR